MNIEIFSDLACPWCFIGKRRLDHALAKRGAQAELGFHAFPIQPGLPAQGVAAAAFFERKFGGKERVRGVFERATQAGLAEGIAFDFAKLERAPNTELAHRVVHFASLRKQAAHAVEALFSGYFEHGMNLCELDEIVVQLAHARVALDSDELRQAIAAGFGQAEVAADLGMAREYGIGGVPLFIFDQRYVVEGAQPALHFERLIDKLRAEDRPHLSAQNPS